MIISGVHNRLRDLGQIPSHMIQELKELLSGIKRIYLSCGTEQVDRVLFRSSESLALKAISWELDKDFVDEKDNGLSDHSAVTVRFN